MPTIFTRAKAMKKVIALLDRQCGVPRSKMQCDSRLGADLGVVGCDTYDILEELETKHGVDMSEFDCHDRIIPEAEPVGAMFAFAGTVVLSTLVAKALFPTLSPGWWTVFGFAAGVFLFWTLSKLCSPKPEPPELLVRDLINALEAKRWISPKTVSGSAG